MTARRVYVVWKNPLFEQSVNLLVRHREIDMLGSNTDIKEAQNEINQLHPDTLIVETTTTGFPVELMDMLESGSEDFRVIGLNLENNEICIYHRNKKVIAKASDLLHFVLE